MLSCFFDNYSPTKKYSQSQIKGIINSRKNVLCFYAKESVQQRCAVGLNFDKFDQRGVAVPLHILTGDEVWALSLTQGEKLKKAYEKSRIGKKIMIIYTAPNCKGWFIMKFKLGKYADATSK